jgi:hypothetical protein
MRKGLNTEKLPAWIVILAIAFLASCAPVRAYQKTYLNDEEMTLSERKVAVFGADFHASREGAVGGTIGNSGSGCGCN